MSNRLIEMLKEHEGYADILKKSTKIDDLSNIPLVGPKNTKIEGTGKFGLYYDSEGKLTGGVGHLVKSKKDAAQFINADETMINDILSKDVESHVKDVDDLLKSKGINKDDLPSNVLDSLYDMGFNMGAKDGKGLGSFNNSLKLIKEGKYKEASENILKSKWAKQVGNRSKTISNLMGGELEHSNSLKSFNGNNLQEELFSGLVPESVNVPEAIEPEVVENPNIIQDLLGGFQPSMPEESVPMAQSVSDDELQNLRKIASDEAATLVGSSSNATDSEGILSVQPQDINYEEDASSELEELAELEAIFGGIQQPQVQAQPQAQEEPRAPIPGALDTASRMATQGATLGFGDEIGGLIQAGISKGADLIGATNPYAVDADLQAQGFTGDLQPSAYDAGLQDERARISEMREARPVLSFASEAAGGLAADAVTGAGPLLSGATYGFGEGEGGLGNRLQSGAIGGALGGVLGQVGQKSAPFLNKAARDVAKKLQTSSVKSTAREIGDRYTHKIAPGVKNIYTAISGNTTQMDVPVLEAMTRQSDLFFGKPVKQNSKAAQTTLNEEMTRLNKELSKMTKQVAAESGDNMLAEFQPFSDSIRRQADLLNSENLRRMADQFDDAILSGDYEEIFNTYRRLIKNRRQYDDMGKISRYKGANPDIVEELDMLFTDANYKFLDDASRAYDLNMNFVDDAAGAYQNSGGSYSKQLSDSLSRLRDLHIVDRHLDEANRFVRKSGIGSVSLQDSLAGGALGGLIGAGVGAPQFGAVAGAIGAATLRRSVAVNNIIGNLRYNMYQGMPLAVNAAKGTLSRSINGALDAAQRFGDDLAAAGVNPAIISQLSKAATSGFIDRAETEQAALALMQQVPEIFDEGRYASEVDGRVTSPDDVAKEQIRINQELKGDAIARARALSDLNKWGTIYTPSDSLKPKRQLVKPMKGSEQPSTVDESRVEYENEMKEFQELEAIFGGN